MTRNFRRPSTAAVGLGSVLTLLVLAGCTSVPRAEDVVGRWDYHEESSDFGVSDGSCLFSPDQTFSCTDFPLELLQHEGWAGAGAFSGTWEVVERQVGVDYPGVEVHTDPVEQGQGADRTRFTFQVRGSGDEMQLFLWMKGGVDTGDTYELVRGEA